MNVIFSSFLGFTQKGKWARGKIYIHYKYTQYIYTIYIHNKYIQYKYSIIYEYRNAEYVFAVKIKQWFYVVEKVEHKYSYLVADKETRLWIKIISVVVNIFQPNYLLVQTKENSLWVGRRRVGESFINDRYCTSPHNSLQENVAMASTYSSKGSYITDL